MTINKLQAGMAAALLALWLAAPALASTFSDVDPGHWAYDAIDYLQDAGLVEGYPDGTFRGDRAFTRYEMAMVIARVFTKIQDWQAMYDAGTLPGSAADVDMSEVYARLDRLSEEFRDELSDLGARVTAVEDEQVRLRGEVDDLKALIKDSGLSGVARFRTGGFFATGREDLPNEPGYESYLQLTYKFQPETNLDFKFTLTAADMEGPVGTAWVPGANNETLYTTVPNPPHGNSANAASFVIDEANFKYYWCNAPRFLGEGVTITGGRQYFSEGEFGLAGDNGYRSNIGVRFDTKYGRKMDAYAGLYRMESVANVAAFSDPESLAFQSSALTAEGDDFMLAGLEYHTGEGTVRGHDYKTVVRLDGTLNGYGNEQYVGVSGNVQLPEWISDRVLTGLRGEWVYVLNNVSNFNPDSDLGLTPYSFIFELDLVTTDRSRVSAAFAHLAQIEALPVLANVDNDPFSEWDFTVNNANDAFNLSREGRNYFPSDFVGFGLQAEHQLGSTLHTTLSYYNGQRIDSASTDRPGMVKLNLRYPFTNNSSFGLDVIAAGERSGLDDPIGMVRGEFKIHF
ncbi:S-layer homology domain-containing protein [bacterium]|nr:S-layer homology domain-containing protein [bacterium]